MPHAEQVIHILGQHDIVWCGILAPKPLHTLAEVLQEERRLISQHQNRHIAGKIKELSVHFGDLQPDIDPDAVKAVLVLAAHSAYDMFSWYKCLIVNLVFPRLGFLEWESFSDCAFS